VLRAESRMSRTLNLALQQEEGIVVTQNFGWEEEEAEVTEMRKALEEISAKISRR